MDGVLIFPIDEHRMAIVTRLSVDEAVKYAREKGFDIRIKQDARSGFPEVGLDSDWRLFFCDE